MASYGHFVFVFDKLSFKEVSETGKICSKKLCIHLKITWSLKRIFRLFIFSVFATIYNS